MSATLIDGRALAKASNAELAAAVRAMARRPGLAVLLVGEDAASQVYVANKGAVADRIGFHHVQVNLPANASQEAVFAAVDALCADPTIDGVLVQLPLPPHLDALAVLDRVRPEKDVDGITAVSAGLLSQGRPRFVACTPQGVMRMIASVGGELSGREAVVIGRSNIVGRPMAMLLEQAGATVTLCHSRTARLQEVVRRGDVVVAAVGRPELVRADWIKPGAVVIDVGMNRLADGRLVGDVDFAGVSAVAGALTPVPGGVGPMTIAMLMRNTWLAATQRSA